ncbi:MAG: hypothetical protein COA71_10120 [SAR86 cluster bacterium]|uniref:Uncharacterized protein n=1 Tax=SAR86 cluster bacterium TaxID=2030880 RepID=A0A2A5C9V6_9GAMM|nr:MAG: hypothetical protein COA71_10120 [SAR86 cluster bacterium]
MADATDLLLLQQKLRQCKSIVQLGHSIVNQSTRIADYQVSVLWINKTFSKGSVQAVSGLPEPIKNTPFTAWIEEVCKKLSVANFEKSTAIDKNEFTEDQQIKWREFFPSDLVWVPLRYQDKDVGGLLLGRSTSWEEEELSILNYWAGAVAHAIGSLLKTREKKSTQVKQAISNKRYFWIGLAAAFLIAWIPVPLSVNARAEIVPLNPIIVRSPIEGIIGEVFVQPNQGVLPGDLILAFDDTNLQSQKDLADQELAIAQAEYQSVNQAAVRNRDIASELPVLQAVIEQRQTQLRYTQSLLDRSNIYAEKQGIVVIPKVTELEGMPVQVGERLFTLAEPGEVELEFWLAVGDGIPLPYNARVTMFLNVYPEQAHRGNVRFVNYQAEVSPDGILGYRGRAEFITNEELRIGWRGTAKIYGEDVRLFYYLFRRPLSALRQWAGI